MSARSRAKCRRCCPKSCTRSIVDLFLLNKASNTLDRIPNDLTPTPLSVAYEQPKGAYAAAISLCYRNRTLLNVPDFRKSPLQEMAQEADLPAASIFVPMFAQGEILGVIAVNFRSRPQAEPQPTDRTAACGESGGGVTEAPGAAIRSESNCFGPRRWLRPVSLSPEWRMICAPL